MRCCFAEQVVIYHIGLIASQYFKILGDKDRHGFTKHTVVSVILIVSEAFVSWQLLFQIYFCQWFQYIWVMFA